MASPNEQIYNIDTEALFTLIDKKNWKELAKTLYHNSNAIDRDPIAKHAAGIFQQEFFTYFDGKSDKEKLEQLDFTSLLVESRSTAFKQEFADKIIDEKLRLLKDTDASKELLFNLAASNQHRPIAKEIITAINTEAPTVIADLVRENTSVNATVINDGEQATIRLFKSKQELNFYRAMSNAFPNHHHYPNVAVSCIFDFDKINYHLSGDEKTYFFKAIVDCVIFDQNDGYLPKFYFELDSVYHDTEDQKYNDAMKKRIFERANVQLINIRPEKSEDMSVSAFSSLILDVVKGI